MTTEWIVVGLVTAYIFFMSATVSFLWSSVRRLEEIAEHLGRDRRSPSQASGKARNDK